MEERTAVRPYPAAFCVFGGISVLSVFPRAAPQRRGERLGARRFVVYPRLRRFLRRLLGWAVA